MSDIGCPQKVCALARLPPECTKCTARFLVKKTERGRQCCLISAQEHRSWETGHSTCEGEEYKRVDAVQTAHCGCLSAVASRAHPRTNRVKTPVPSNREETVEEVLQPSPFAKQSVSECPSASQQGGKSWKCIRSGPQKHIQDKLRSRMCFFVSRSILAQGVVIAGVITAVWASVPRRLDQEMKEEMKEERTSDKHVAKCGNCFEIFSTLLRNVDFLNKIGKCKTIGTCTSIGNAKNMEKANT